MKIQSSAFEAGQTIPARYSVAEGENISPALFWTGVPAGTKALALIVDDPDAPMGTFVHWVLYNLPGDAAGLPEAVPAKGPAPGGALQGVNDFGHMGYGGPQPPKGHGVHHYHFKLYALDGPIALGAGATKADLVGAMTGRILAESELVGVYERN
jgi:Raf kinase inhibitor-like YbhB/YbcL family protein